VTTTGGADELDRAREDLAAAKAEIARLRGRLVGLNEELGEARGELAVTRARWQRLRQAGLAVWVRVPVLGRIPEFIVHRLEARRGRS
jgi:multidrug resistance efflux pump